MQGSELRYEVEVAGSPLCIIRNGRDGGDKSFLSDLTSFFTISPSLSLIIHQHIHSTPLLSLIPCKVRMDKRFSVGLRMDK